LKKKPIKILKKPTGSVRFYKPKTKKTETEQKKPSQTGKKTKPNRFQFGSGFFFKKKFGLVIFFIKTVPNKK
jgi:hypothetical protein